MVIIDGWLDWAERRAGHPQKVYSQANAGLGIACHSIVGNLPNHSIPARFLSDERMPGNPSQFAPMAQASVMFILYRDGHLIQMYPVTASTWTSGGYEGNTRYWAVEAEGGFDPVTEPLTREAEDTFIRLATEWEAHSGLRAAPGVNILEHRDIARMFGYDATACASGRYSNAWARIAAGERYGDNQMTVEERELLLAVAAALTGQRDATAMLQALAAWNANGNSLLDGYAGEQVKLGETAAQISEHIANHQAGLYKATSLKGTTFTGVIQ